MKKMMYLLLAGALVITVGQSCKKKMSDADITKGLTEKLGTMTPPVAFMVKDGAVTLSGSCKDSASYKAAVAAVTAFNKDLKVTNSLTVAPPPPPPASVGQVMDAAVMQKVKDGVKDIKGLVLAFANGKAVLSGAISAADNIKIGQILASAKVMADRAGLTVK